MCEVAEAGDMGRLSDEISLNLIAVFRAQETQLLTGLDTFRQHRQIQPAPDAEHRANDGRRLFVGVDRLDEGAVDLDLVEREGPQVRQRRVTGSEIVHRDAHAEGLELTQRHQRAVEVADQRGFGNLEFEPTGLQPGLTQAFVNELRELRIVQLHRRDVDGYPERIRPATGFRARLPQHPFADLLDRAAFLGDGNEQGGRNLTALRVTPPQQGFEAGDFARIKPDLRLIGQFEFVPRDRAAKIVLQHATLARLDAHG